MSLLIQAFVSIFIETLCMLIWYMGLFQTRFSETLKTVLVGMLFSVPLTALVVIGGNWEPVWLGLVVSILSAYAVCRVLFISKRGNALLAAAIFIGLLTAIDSLILFLLVSFKGISTDVLYESPQLTYLGTAISKIITLLIIVSFIYYWSKKKSKTIFVTKHWLWFLFIPLITIVSIHSLIESYEANIVLVVASCMLLLNVASFIILAVIEEQHEKVKDFSLVKQHAEFQEKNMQSMLERIDYSRSLLHDIDNHLTTITYLASENKMEEAFTYASTIKALIDNGLYRIKTGNDVVDAMLNEKYHSASHHGIQMKMKVSDIADIAIEPFALVTILGNALDNAIEATVKVKGPRLINSTILHEGQMLYFSFDNPMVDELHFKGDKLASLKKSEFSGYGLKNIEKVAAAHNGDVNYYVEDGRFFLVITIRL